jgi:tetratricopeptide (TPR) repeat protein
VVTAGSVLVLHKDGLLMCSIEAKSPPTSTYKNGTISLGFGARLSWNMALGAANQQADNIPQRKFVAGETFWVSDFLTKDDGVYFQFYSDPYDNIRYYGQLRFPFPKGGIPPAGDVMKTIAEAITVQPTTQEPPPPDTAAPPGLTNHDVLKMVQAQLPDSVVVAKIKASNCQFDTNPEALIALKQAGVSEAVLKTMAEAPVTGPPEPSPPPICSEYASCINSGLASLTSSQWDQSLAYAQAASELNPDGGDAWALISYAYFEMGRYDESLPMGEKALRLGATLTANVCRTRGTECETGWIRMSIKEVSLLDSRGQKVFAVPPASVASQPAQLSGSGKSAYLSLQISGKTYNLFLVPIGLKCTIAADVECPEPGLTQQKVFADQLHQGLLKFASGKLNSSPNPH